MTNDEKRNRLLIERNQLQEEYDALSKKDTTWGGEFSKNVQMEQLEKRILGINEEIKNYGSTVGDVVSKNKTYWEEEKKER